MHTHRGFLIPKTEQQGYYIKRTHNQRCSKPIAFYYALSMALNCSKNTRTAAGKTELQKATERADKPQAQIDTLTKAANMRDMRTGVRQDHGPLGNRCTRISIHAPHAGGCDKPVWHSIFPSLLFLLYHTRLQSTLFFRFIRYNKKEQNFF